jgi:hypothetical protein
VDTRKPPSTRAEVMEKIEAMAEEAGLFQDGMITTDCIILWRGERIDGSAVRARLHPLGPMDDLRERGLIEQHHDDVVDEDRLRR